MQDKISKKYANVTIVIIKAFLQACLHCCLKKSRTRKNLVVKPIISPRAWHRWQTDLIDMQAQADGQYKYIQVTQDHFTKFCFLQPLKQKTAVAVAENQGNILNMKQRFSMLERTHILRHLCWPEKLSLCQKDMYFTSF